MDESYIDFATAMNTVDCMIMGRKCMEKISSFDLSPKQWPYGTMKVIVLSNTAQTPRICHIGDAPHIADIRRTSKNS
ncbi:hypothetical protein K3727_19545 [Rhodobacteraceae bacterium M382]|nr:hypothetical protein K3727_19545 [Rhodobacteraceae bacterium M382]